MPKVKIQPEQDFIQKITEQAMSFNPVSQVDKEEITRKIDEITKRKCVNLTEEQFIIFMNLQNQIKEETLEQWCQENLQFQTGFSPDYEFDETTDFLTERKG